jgi:alkanesulfonate monooxygenase SsuD/methylene tetrahydromethanopterin reductase-like flavin-dependent oxidoreductase (luciferase family)
MSPAPCQLLAYYAGRRQRITLGTAVIVLPWHDPIRVAEEIALLDIMCGGRCLFGFGRGAASVEYEGFRIDQGEARPRFIEAARIIQLALSQESFEFRGDYFRIPRTAIRPRPISHPEQRFYGTAVSADSVEVMAKLGFSMLVIMQNEWPKAAADIHRFNALAAAEGYRPRPPMILTNVAIAPSRAEAQERAIEFLGRKWDSIDNHYRFSDGHLNTVKGYESYDKVGQTYAKMKDPTRRAKATEFYVSIQLVGTPDDCVQKLEELQSLTGLDHLITEFAFGGLPHAEAERGMRLFAETVLPVLQHDPRFAKPPELLRPLADPTKDGLFAPA